MVLADPRAGGVDPPAVIRTCTRSVAEDMSGGCPPSSQMTESRYSSPCSRSSTAAVRSWYSPSATVINRKLFSALSPASVHSKRPLRPSSASETTTCATNVSSGTDSGTRATSALPDACDTPSFYTHETIGSRPSDHYFRSVCLSVCLFVCAEFFQPSSIRFGSN